MTITNRLTSINNNVRERNPFSYNVARYALKNKVSPAVAVSKMGKTHSRFVIAVGDTAFLAGGLLKTGYIIGTASMNPVVPIVTAGLGLLVGNIGRFSYIFADKFKHKKLVKNYLKRKMTVVTNKIEKTKNIKKVV